MIERGTDLDEAIREALAASFLARMPAAAVQRLLRDAVSVEYPAGSIVYREGGQPRFALVVAGLFRIYLASPAGRQVTFRYADRGAVVGTVTALAGPAPACLQALTGGRLLLLNLTALHDLGATDASVGWSMAEELSHRIYDILEELAAAAFGSVSERIARGLLDLAAQQQQGSLLVARVSQQELADVVGSVREVVARVLRDLRTAGLIRTSRAGIVLLDPLGLHARAWNRTPRDQGHSAR